MSDLRGNRNTNAGGGNKTVKIIGAVAVAAAIIAAASYAYEAATAKSPPPSFPKSFNSSAIYSPAPSA